MAFIPTESRGASLGGLLGTSLGSGLAQQVQSNIDLLMHQKAQKMAQAAQEAQQSKLAQAFQVLNIPREQAEAIAALPPKLQELALYNAEQRSMPQMQEAPVSALESLQQMPQQEYPRGAMTSLIGGKPGPVVVPFEAAQPFPQKQIQKNQPAQRQIATQQQGKSGGFFTPLSKQKLEEKVYLEEKKAQIKDVQLANKETLPVYQEVNKAAKAADENDKRLDRMEKLVNEGNLGVPLANSIIKTISHGIWGHGIDLSSWMTADAQEFDKLSNDFARGAKDVFGSRITQGEVNLFMKTVPNLTQSGAGIKRLIRSMKSFNEAARLRKKTMNEIIKENGGNRPRDLESQIDERAGNLLDALSKDFIGGPRIPERFGGGIIRY